MHHMYIYIYIYMYICMYIYVHVYVNGDVHRYMLKITLIL
jgi:hypothetical protein